MIDLLRITPKLLVDKQAIQEWRAEGCAVRPVDILLAYDGAGNQLVPSCRRYEGGACRDGGESYERELVSGSEELDGAPLPFMEEAHDETERTVHKKTSILFPRARVGA